MKAHNCNVHCARGRNDTGSHHHLGPDSTQGAVQGVLSPPPPVLATDADAEEESEGKNKGGEDEAPLPSSFPMPIRKKKIKKIDMRPTLI